MLGGPGLLVIAGFALLIFGPKKLPELAQTIARALGELKKATEEVKDSVGIKELQEMKASIRNAPLQQLMGRSLSKTDLISEFAERLSASMSSEEAGQGVSSHGEDNLKPTIRNREEKNEQ